MRSDGTVFPAELAISRVEIDGPPVFTACIRDASDRRDTEARLKAGGAPLSHARRAAAARLVRRPVATTRSRSRSTSARRSRRCSVTARRTGFPCPTSTRARSTPTTASGCLRQSGSRTSAASRSRLEYRMTTADGRLVWVEDQSVLVGIDGERGFRQGFAVDITERKQAETALRQAETRFRTLVEQLPLAVYIDRMDEESSNIYTSPQIEPMLGYTRDEWVSDPVPLRRRPAPRRPGAGARRTCGDPRHRRAAAPGLPAYLTGRSHDLGARRGAGDHRARRRRAGVAGLPARHHRTPRGGGAPTASGVSRSAHRPRQPGAVHGSRASTRSSAGVRAARLPCSSSTWTTSRRSTTRSATSPVTRS